MTDTTTPTSTALVTTASIAERLQKATNLGAVLDIISPKPVAEFVGGVPALPKPVVLSDADRATLERLPVVIGSAVVPESRRVLTVDEIVALLDERGVLDRAEALIKARKDSQKTAIFNHHDVRLEASPSFDAENPPLRDKTGHYIAKGVEVPTGATKGFVRQYKEASPSLEAPALEAEIDKHGGDFTKDDYLACTTQVRVLDEAKTMLRLRARPQIISAIRAATKPGAPSTSHNIGKGDS